MLQECVDFRAEADELHALLETLDASDWTRPTPFKSWTVWDVVAHLHFSDHMGVLSITDADAFRAETARIGGARREGIDLAGYTRRDLADLGPNELLERWIETCHELCDRLGAADPSARLPWFGPDMGVRMFTTARQMETWAHGQDVYDLLGVERTYTDRIRSVAEIGVRTFGWTFVNRGLELPGDPPYVLLLAPSGATWEWNAPAGSERVEGSAAEFCHVVTQGRNVADTALEVTGDVARRWMAIAQCFAGGPEDPPAPGERG